MRSKAVGWGSGALKRREFLALAAAFTIGPKAALAQQSAKQGRPWLIAYLTTESEAQANTSSLGPFRSGLSALGYSEGRQFVIEGRYANGDANALADLAKQVVALMPDLILTGNDVSTLAAHDATKTIPTVAYFGGASVDLVLQSVIGTLAKPIGNVTGTFTDSTKVTGKHCDLAVELFPAAKKLGALAFTLTPDGGSGTRNAVLAGAAAHKLIPVIIDVAVPADLAPAFQSLSDQQVDVVIVGSGGVFSSDRGRVAQLALNAHLPSIYNEQGYVEAGGLFSYGFNRATTFTRLASFAELVLKGTAIASIPAEETSSYYTAVNRKTAAALGITISPSIIVAADEVIG